MWHMRSHYAANIDVLKRRSQRAAIHKISRSLNVDGETCFPEFSMEDLASFIQRKTVKTKRQLTKQLFIEYGFDQQG